MKIALIGFLAGVISGIIMAFVSHVCFKHKVFKSSLILIDGSFFFRTLKLTGAPALIQGAGIVIHLVTSGIFGIIYVVAAHVLGFNALSFSSVSLYVLFLWLSMLFIALPIAGEGILGKNSGAFAWFEQLVLHIIFWAVYFLMLKAFL